MAKSQISKLSKDDQKRHFPEKTGGKGDLRYRGRRGKNAYNDEDNLYRSNKFWSNTDKERELQQKEAEKRMMREEKARLSREICGK